MNITLLHRNRAIDGLLYIEGSMPSVTVNTRETAECARKDLGNCGKGLTHSGPFATLAGLSRI